MHSTKNTNKTEIKNKNLYLNYVEAANNRDFSAIEKMINDEVLLNGKVSKKEDAIKGFEWIIDQIPNHHWHLEDFFLQDDRIAARLRNTGTPKEKSFYGENKNAKSVQFSEFATYKIQNEKFVEMWFLVDTISIIDQLKN